MITVSALAIDGATMAAATMAPTMYPSFFMRFLQCEFAGLEPYRRQNVPREKQEISEQAFSLVNDGRFGAPPLTNWLARQSRSRAVAANSRCFTRTLVAGTLSPSLFELRRRSRFALPAGL